MSGIYGLGCSKALCAVEASENEQFLVGTFLPTGATADADNGTNINEIHLIEVVDGTKIHCLNLFRCATQIQQIEGI